MQNNQNRSPSFQVMSASRPLTPRKQRSISGPRGHAVSEGMKCMFCRTANITADFQRKLLLSIKAALSLSCVCEEDPEPASPKGLLTGSGKKAHRRNKRK